MKTKFIIEQDRKAIEADLHPYERKAWLLNLFLDRMAEAGYPIESVSHLATVISQGAERYIRTQIVEGSNFELAGVRLNKSALMDVIETPDLKEVVSVEVMLKQYHATPLDSLAFEDGRFVVPTEIKERIRDKHTRYAASQRQVDMFHAAQKVVKAVNQFHTEFGQEEGRALAQHPLGRPEAYLVFNPQKWRFELDTKVILRQQ